MYALSLFSPFRRSAIPFTILLPSPAYTLCIDLLNFTSNKNLSYGLEKI